MEKNKYKVCSCKEEFSEVRICCTGCGRSGLTANEAAVVESTNINESLPFLTPLQNAKRAKIERRIAENACKPRMVAAYLGLGLTEAEAKIAAGVEARLTNMSEADFAKFEF